MWKQNGKSIHAGSVILITPYCACEYFCLEHYIFPLQVSSVKKKKLCQTLPSGEIPWYFKCSFYENKQAKDIGYDKLVEGMQNAEVTIHDCNTKIKPI
jgi:hypothetical protein